MTAVSVLAPVRHRWDLPPAAEVPVKPPAGVLLKTCWQVAAELYRVHAPDELLGVCRNCGEPECSVACWAYGQLRILEREPEPGADR